MSAEPNLPELVAGSPVAISVRGARVIATVAGRVEPDPTAGQYEGGWWVRDSDAPDGEDDEHDFFLSDDGIVYGLDSDLHAWGTAVGKVL